MIDAEQHYRERMAVFARERIEPGGIVFLGASHLEWFDTDRLLPGRRIVNRGIASDRLCVGDRGVLRRLDISVFACQPSFIVFQNGINDVGELAREGEPSLEEILELYERVVAAIRERLPAVPMCLVNEMPTSGRFAICLPYVVPLNEHIQRVAEKYDCLHMDLYSIVVNGAGSLRADLTDDGLHLNERGYDLWAEELGPMMPDDR